MDNSVRGRKRFLRCNNLHVVPGHKDPHHENSYDWRTEEHLPKSPEWVGEAGWPTLGEYLDEVREWYWTHHEELPEPDKYGAIELRG